VSLYFIVPLVPVMIEDIYVVPDFKMEMKIMNNEYILASSSCMRVTTPKTVILSSLLWSA